MTAAPFELAAIYDLAFRRCGTGRARFREIGAPATRSLEYVTKRIAEMALEVDFVSVGSEESDLVDGVSSGPTIDFLALHEQVLVAAPDAELDRWWGTSSLGD